MNGEYSSDKIKVKGLQFSINHKLNSHPEKGVDVWGGPTINADMEVSGTTLKNRTVSKSVRPKSGRQI